MLCPAVKRQLFHFYLNITFNLLDELFSHLTYTVVLRYLNFKLKRLLSHELNNKHTKRDTFRLLLTLVMLTSDLEEWPFNHL